MNYSDIEANMPPSVAVWHSPLRAEKIRAYKRIATDLSDPNNILPKLIVDISISAEEPSISQWCAVYTILPKV